MIFEDVEEAPPAPVQFCLRDYQEKWNEDIEADRQSGLTRLLADAPGGCGKTTVFAALARKEVARGGRVLVLENRDRLTDQTADRIRIETGLDVEIERADDIASPTAKVVVASVQTLGRVGRLTGFPDDHFTLVIPDECFPAGTIIDGRKIEDIRPGDFVNSYNHSTGCIEQKKVLRLFKNPAMSLVRVEVCGRSIVCTPSHPFFTDHGYIAAKDLRGRQCALLKDHSFPLQALRGNGGVPRQDSLLHQSSSGERAASPLLKEVRGRGLDTTSGGHREEIVGMESEALLGAHEEKQSDEQPRHGRKDEACVQGEDIPLARRQRDTDEAAGGAISSTREPAHGVCDSDRSRHGEISVSPHVLQGGSRGPGVEAGDRGGRRIASQQEVEIPGCQKNGGLEFSWVDGVEVLESRGGPRYPQVCPDGFVYNFEVEGNNNYFVDGVLVHNCHHSLAPQWRRILCYFHYGAESLDDEWIMPKDGTYIPKATIVGFTATPDIGDKKNLGQIFQKFSVRYTYLDAVTDGWLVPPITENIPVKIDLRKFKTGRTPNGSDFKPQDLTAALVPIIEELAKQVVERASKRKTIAFVPSIECARLLAEAIKRQGLHAIFVSGECLDVDEKTEDFVRSGPGTVLCNAALYVEGADFPDIDCVAWFRATISRAFYIQGVYRGTRVLPGVLKGCDTASERRDAIAMSAKPNLLILDPLFVSDRIDLCDAYDLFTDKPEVKKKMKDAGDLSAEGADKAERDFIASLEKAAKKHARKQARTINPLAWAVSMGDAKLASYRPETDSDRRPPTEAQAELLRRHHIDMSKVTCFGLASKMIGIILTRHTMKLATVGQLDFLHRLGVSEEQASTLKADEASALIDRLKKDRGWA